MRSLPEIIRAVLVGGVRSTEERDALLALADRIQATDRPETGEAIGEVGSPYGVHDTVIDGSRALILSEFVVAMSDQSDGRRLAVLQFHGRINRSQEHTTFAVIVDPDGLASVSSQIVALMQRERGRFARDYAARFALRMGEMP